MDVEALAFVGAKLARFKGYMSSQTYSAITDALNRAQGELSSLKAHNGRLMADVDTARQEIDALKGELALTRGELESLRPSAVVDAPPAVVVETVTVTEGTTE